MELQSKDKLILLQNLLNRSVELAIAQRGKDVTIDDVDKLLTELAKLVGNRIAKF